MSLYDSILITGGGGMLGIALGDLLIARGHRPISLSRAQLDITNERDVKSAFTLHRPTLVLNCAAHTKVDLCEQEKEKADDINGWAVGKIAALCRDSGTIMVHVSTDFVFDGEKKRPYEPLDRVHPINAYGSSKLLGETELKKNAPARWLIMRTSWVYGRGGVNFPRTMVQAAQAGKPLKVVNDQVGCPTYTVDLAGAICNLLDSGAKGIWHVTNTGETNWFDFARAVLREFAIPAEVTPLTSAQWTQMRPSSCLRPNYSVLDNRPYAKQTGKPMRNWQDALKDFHLDVDKKGF